MLDEIQMSFVLMTGLSRETIQFQQRWQRQSLRKQAMPLLGSTYPKPLRYLRMQPHTQRVCNLQHSSETRIAVFTERFVQTLTTQA